MIGMAANLEIARRALQAHQLAMSVIGTNIANVNTPGYSRRRTVIQATSEVDTGVGFVGAGAEVWDIRRVRNAMLDSLYRKHKGGIGKWSVVQEYLSKVETAVNEPGSAGLSEALSAFWASWQDLANEPENESVRAQVRLRGEQLCEVFHRVQGHLRSFQDGLSDEIDSQISGVNEIAARLAEINSMITRSEFENHEASGLRDERDLLVDELSEIVNIQSEEAPDKTLTVMIGSQVLVQGGTSRELEVVSGVGRSPNSSQFVWVGGKSEVSVESGLLYGCLSARDDYIEGYLSDLDALAGALVSEVNRAHAIGYGLDGSQGTNFFNLDAVTAADIRIDSAIMSDLDLIAASAGGQQGDGLNALAIGNLASARVMTDGSSTFDNFYSTLVGRIGLDSREAASLLDADGILIQDIDNQRMEVSGVSLDEEMAYLLSYQHAYEAMVRVVTTIDEMTISLINAVG